jgi:hypothetical protein
MKKAYAVTVALLICMNLCIFQTGCGTSQVVNVINAIDAQLPPAMQTAASIASLSGNPQLAAVFQTVGQLAVTDGPVISATIAAWKANQNAGNLQAIIAAVNTLASGVNQQLLAANRLVNTDNERLALASLTGLVATINGFSIALAAVNKNAKTAMLRAPTPYTAVAEYIPRREIERVAASYGVSAGDVLAIVQST